MKGRFVFSPKELSQEFDGYTLVISAVSIGQVGQTVTELLINSLDFKLDGFIVDDSLLPISGRQPFKTSSYKLCSSLEVFVSHKHHLVVLHQRSPFVKGRVPEFRRKLFQWIKERKFKGVVMCSSVSSHIRNDAELASDSIHYLTTVDDKKTQLNCLAKEYQKFKSDDKTLTLPGGGIVRSIYEKSLEDGVPFTALLKFHTPGFLHRDAILLTQQLLNLQCITATLNTDVSSLNKDTSCGGNSLLY